MKIFSDSNQTFKSELDLILKSFSQVNDWSDFVQLLENIQSVIEKYGDTEETIPSLHMLVKRLIQSLDSALPTGIHNQVLKIYSIIFKKCKKEYLIANFNVLTIGLFKFAVDCKFLLAKTYVNLIGEYIVPIVNELPIHYDLILLGFFPFLELDAGEIYDRTFGYLSELYRILSTKSNEAEATDAFLIGLYRLFISYPMLRLNIIVFITRHKLSCKIHTVEMYKVMCKAFCEGLEEKRIVLIPRLILDNLTVAFPLEIRVPEKQLEIDDSESKTDKTLSIFEKNFNDKVKYEIVANPLQQDEKAATELSLLNKFILKSVLKALLLKENQINIRVLKFFSVYKYSENEEHQEEEGNNDQFNKELLIKTLSGFLNIKDIVTYIKLSQMIMLQKDTLEILYPGSVLPLIIFAKENPEVLEKVVPVISSAFCTVWKSLIQKVASKTINLDLVFFALTNMKITFNESSSVYFDLLMIAIFKNRLFYELLENREMYKIFKFYLRNKSQKNSSRNSIYVSQMIKDSLMLDVQDTSNATAVISSEIHDNCSKSSEHSSCSISYFGKNLQKHHLEISEVNSEELAFICKFYEDEEFFTDKNLEKLNSFDLPAFLVREIFNMGNYQMKPIKIVDIHQYQGKLMVRKGRIVIDDSETNAVTHILDEQAKIFSLYDLKIFDAIFKLFEITIKGNRACEKFFKYLSHNFLLKEFDYKDLVDYFINNFHSNSVSNEDENTGDENSFTLQLKQNIYGNYMEVKNPHFIAIYGSLMESFLMEKMKNQDIEFADLKNILLTCIQHGRCVSVVLELLYTQQKTEIRDVEYFQFIQNIDKFDDIFDLLTEEFNNCLENSSYHNCVVANTEDDIFSIDLDDTCYKITHLMQVIAVLSDLAENREFVNSYAEKIVKLLNSVLNVVEDCERFSDEEILMLIRSIYKLLYDISNFITTKLDIKFVRRFEYYPDVCKHTVFMILDDIPLLQQYLTRFPKIVVSEIIRLDKTIILDQVLNEDAGIPHSSLISAYEELFALEKFQSEIRNRLFTKFFLYILKKLDEFSILYMITFKGCKYKLSLETTNTRVENLESDNFSLSFIEMIQNRKNKKPVEFSLRFKALEESKKLVWISIKLYKMAQTLFDDIISTDMRAIKYLYALRAISPEHLISLYNRVFCSFSHKILFIVSDDLFITKKNLVDRFSNPKLSLLDVLTFFKIHLSSYESDLYLDSEIFKFLSSAFKKNRTALLTLLFFCCCARLNTTSYDSLSLLITDMSDKKTFQFICEVFNIDGHFDRSIDKDYQGVENIFDFILRNYFYSFRGFLLDTTNNSGISCTIDESEKPFLVVDVCKQFFKSFKDTAVKSFVSFFFTDKFLLDNIEMTYRLLILFYEDFDIDNMISKILQSLTSSFFRFSFSTKETVLDKLNLLVLAAPYNEFNRFSDKLVTMVVDMFTSTDENVNISAAYFIRTLLLKMDHNRIDKIYPIIVESAILNCDLRNVDMSFKDNRINFKTNTRLFFAILNIIDLSLYLHSSVFVFNDFIQSQQTIYHGFYTKPEIERILDEALNNHAEVTESENSDSSGYKILLDGNLLTDHVESLSIDLNIVGKYFAIALSYYENIIVSFRGRNIDHLISRIIYRFKKPSST